MKKKALILVLMLILGIVFISGCTQQQNTTGNTSSQNQSGNSQGQGIGNKSIINNKNMSNLTNKTGSNNSSGVGIKY